MIDMNRDTIWAIYEVLGIIDHHLENDNGDWCNSEWDDGYDTACHHIKEDVLKLLRGEEAERKTNETNSHR